MTKTFATFIVPFDFSANAGEALRLAAQLAARAQGTLVLAHGMQIPIMGSLNPAVSAEELVESVREHVSKRLAGTLAANGLAGEVVVKAEDPDLWLADYAAGKRDPVLVLSRHGWSGKHEGAGTVAKRVLRMARCPVWLVGGAGVEITRVVAAVDVDRGSGRVAQLARGLALELGAALELLHVRDPRAETGYLSEIGWPPAIGLFDDLRKQAEAALQKLTRELAAPGLAVTARMASGSPAAAIGRECEAVKAELVVCGKHAKSAIETLLLGSTTAELARLYKGHLLVVP
jgi:nucleotide-binding universal stress UspA family protein